MATYRSGANSRIVIGKEPSFNTADPTPVGHVLRKANFTFNGIKDYVENPELRSDPNPPPGYAGLQRTTAQLVVPVTTDELALLLYFFFGSYANSGASAPYTHTYKVSATNPPSCWVEVGDSGLTKYDLFNGLYVQQISFGNVTKASQVIMATVDFVGSGKYTLNGGSAQDASPDAYTNDLHLMKDVTVEVDTVATAIISSTNVTLARTINQYPVLDGNAYMAEASLDKYTFQVTTTGWRDSADTLVGLDDGAEHQLEVIMPRAGDATRYVNVEFPESYVLNTEGAAQVGDAPVEYTVRWAPFYVNHADASSVVVTILGDVADYDAVW